MIRKFLPHPHHLQMRDFTDASDPASLSDRLLIFFRKVGSSEHVRPPCTKPLKLLQPARHPSGSASCRHNGLPSSSLIGTCARRAYSVTLLAHTRSHKGDLDIRSSFNHSMARLHCLPHASHLHLRHSFSPTPAHRSQHFSSPYRPGHSHPEYLPSTSAHISP